MYTLKVQNDRNEILSLTDNKNFIVEKINGLSPMPAEISTTAAVGYDGSIFTNGRCDKRNITLSVIPRGNIETSRQMLYRYFVPKKSVRLFFTNTNRDVYIDCEVETVEIDLFSPIQTADISLICPQPYFIRNEEHEHSFVISDNRLHTSIVGGEAESGCIFDITLNAISSEFSPIVIENVTHGEKITINNQAYLGYFKVNTNPGEKQATYKLNDSSDTYNIISRLIIDNGKWVTVHPGTNVIEIYIPDRTASIENVLSANMTIDRYYIGV